MCTNNVFQDFNANISLYVLSENSHVTPAVVVEEVKDGEMTVPTIIVAPESDLMTLTVTVTNLTEEETAPAEEEEGGRIETDPNMTDLLSVDE